MFPVAMQDDLLQSSSEDSENGWHDFSSKDLGIPGSPAILVDHNHQAGDPDLEDPLENRCVAPP